MQDWNKVRVVGKRKETTLTPIDGGYQEFVELAWWFRKDRLFVPRGVYRFKTFEEANEWREKMMLGMKPTADLQTSRT